MTADQNDPLDMALEWLLRVQQNPEDGELREQLARWLASDERHLEAWRQAQRAWRVSGLASPAIGEPARTVPGPQHRRRRRWLPALAAAVVCCAVLLLHEELYLSWQADHRTAGGERRELSLPDGSAVVLNADSAIAVDFNEQQRTVRLLSGQAYFAVEPDAQRPFRVTTGQLLVTVTGTAFDVDSQRERVSVAQGSVSVADNHTELRLKAGEGAQLNTAGQLEGHASPPLQVAAWREGRLVLRQERIADVVQALRPYSQAIILLADARLAETRITGVYDLDDPQRTLQTILQLHGGQLSRVGPLVVLRSR